jgi:hypothetical protein
MFKYSGESVLKPCNPFLSLLRRDSATENLWPVATQPTLLYMTRGCKQLAEEGGRHFFLLSVQNAI